MKSSPSLHLFKRSGLDLRESRRSLINSLLSSSRLFWACLGHEEEKIRSLPRPYWRHEVIRLPFPSRPLRWLIALLQTTLSTIHSHAAPRTC